MENLQGLTKRERQIMDVLFELGEGSASQVHERVPDAPTYTAVRTMLKLMEDKGLIHHYEDGRKFVYRPTQSTKSEGKWALGRVLRVFFGGSLEDAIAAHLNDSKVQLDAEEVARLHKIIDQAADERKPSKRSGKKR